MRMMGWAKSIGLIISICLLICSGSNHEKVGAKLFSLEHVLTIDEEISSGDAAGLEA